MTVKLQFGQGSHAGPMYTKEEDDLIRKHWIKRKTAESLDILEPLIRRRTRGSIYKRARVLGLLQTLVGRTKSDPAVLKALAEGPATIAMLKVRTDLTERAVAWALEGLCAEGRVVRRGTTEALCAMHPAVVWQLPDGLPTDPPPPSSNPRHHDYRYLTRNKRLTSDDIKAREDTGVGTAHNPWHNPFKL